jgi:hypothetical protein
MPSIGTHRRISVKKALIALAIAGSAVLASVAPALAVNHPFIPANECAQSSAAGGRPAASREQSDVAGAPFSLNNPGASTGAQGGEHSQAPCLTE